MAGKIDLSIWNLTLVAAAACGPLIPAEDSGTNTIGEDDSGDSGDDIGTDDATTIDPCIGDDCPECQDSSDCPPGYYCNGQQCVYEYYCGAVPGGDVFRCSPWYECYDDSWCSEDEVCIANYCEPIPCESSGYQSVLQIAVPQAPVVDLVFVDVDGQGSDELAIVASDRVDIVSAAGDPISSVVVGNLLAAVAVADVDGDADLDLVAGDASGGGQLFVLVNDGAGVFTPQAPIATLGEVRDVVLADPENDGAVDAFVLTSSAIARHVDLGASSLLVEGGGTAMAIAGWSMAYSNDQTWWLPVATPEPPEPTLMVEVPIHVLATASLDFGGDPDVIGLRTGEVDSQVFFWDGPIADFVGMSTLPGPYTVIVAAEVFGGGIDYAVVAGPGHAAVLTGEPGEPSCQGSLEIPGMGVPRSIAAGDLDGDGYEEVAISDGQQIVVLDDVDLGG